MKLAIDKATNYINNTWNDSSAVVKTLRSTHRVSFYATYELSARAILLQISTSCRGIIELDTKSLGSLKRSINPQY